MRLLRTPLLHFVAGGALLFFATRVVRTAEGLAGPPAEPVVVTAADVAQLKTAYTAETGLTPTAADEAALVEDAIEEELLFREAVARGLDRNDRSVRSWLVEQMRSLTDDARASDDALYARALALGLDRQDLVVRRILIHKVRLLAARSGERDATEDELRAYYAAHVRNGLLPDRVTFWHVFLAADASDPDAVQRAEQQLAVLRERRLPPREAVRDGDSFALSPHMVAQSHAQLAKVFGARFADAVLASPENAWSGPIASPFGLHLVWVEHREPGAAPPFEDVRGRILEAWRQEERSARLARVLRELRTRYPLHVESAAWRERRAKA